MSTSRPRVKVLFVGGLGRRGTTLLERLLGQLPGAVPVGEVAQLWDRGVRDEEYCACGTPFGSCEFWRRVGQAAFGGWQNLDSDRVAALRATVDRAGNIPALAARELKPAHRELVSEYTSYYRRVYTAAAADARARVIVDSARDVSLAYCLRWCPDIDLRVVHVVRDSRSGEPTEPRSTVRTAWRWNTHNAAFGLLRRRGAAVHRVRHEELLADPRRVVAGVADWAEIPVTEPQLRYLGADWADLGPNHSATGSPLRFTVGRIPLGYDESWQPRLPAARRRVVSTLTRPLLSRYGYLRGVPVPGFDHPLSMNARTEELPSFP